MTVAISQSNYIPWKGYFNLIAKADVFVIYDQVQYTKNDWRNRNLIATKNGTQWLTIPVRQTSLEQRICDTEIADNGKWAKKHWNAIKTNYGKAPYFERYATELEERYKEASELKLLSEINLHFITYFMLELDIHTELKDSISLKLEGDKNERLLKAVKLLGGATYLSGQAAKNYLNTSLFEAEGIKVEWMDYSGYSAYEQNGTEFSHGVSILDLLLQTGDKAPSHLKFV